MIKLVVLKILLPAIFFLFPILSYASTVVLNSGASVDGKIIETNNNYIKIEVEGVFLTYYYDEIKTIDGQKPSNPSSEIKEIPLKNLEKDVNPNPSATDQSKQDILSDSKLILDNEAPEVSIEDKMAEEPKIDIQQKETFEGLNYHNDKIGITIKLPQKWTVKDTPLPLQDAIYLHPETLQAEDNINGIMIIRYKELTDIPDGAPPEIALDALVHDFHKFPGAVEIKNGTTTKFKDLSAYKVNLMMQASEGEAFYFYKGGYEFTIYYSYKEKVIIKEILDSISFDATLTSPPQKQKYALSRLQKIHGMTLIKQSIYLYIIFYYLFSSFITFIMSKKMNVGMAWLAWIPIAKEFLVFKLADISFKWMVLWLIPIILSFIPSLLLVGSFCLYILSISFFIISWLRIIKSFNKSGWLIVPLCIPVIQLFVLGYLAFSKN